MNNAAVIVHIQVLVRTDVFISLGSQTESGIAGSYDDSVELCEELPECFPRQLHHFTSPSAVFEGSNVSTCWPTLVTSF